MTSARPPALLLPLAATLLLTGPVEAQRGGDGFLFQPPSISVTLHGGFAGATASGDLFTEVTDLLTLERGDFGGLAGGGDLSIFVSPRVALVFGGGYAATTRRSEFRDWVEETPQGELPIEQSTTFARAPVMAGVRAYLTPRGRSVGTFAWVPSSLAPFVGAGAGGVWYRFRQVGDFVDFEDRGIFWDEIESTGWAPALQAVAGLDYSITPRLVLVGETRYLRGKAGLRQTRFQGFDDRIDLSGLSGSAGISFRF
jgi:hypothetical protein